ncbi:MAG: helix-turn-helix transcriptional regulator [Lachnospiraceae bacterium]|nr:helix-turn-helix transcriptional regulator [Lachnospiraceae bacterium]
MQSNIFVMESMPEVQFFIFYGDMDADAIDARIPEDTHMHDECEIYLNLSGDVCFEVEGKLYPVSRGSVIITRPYESHHCIYKSNAYHKHYWITFSARDNQNLLNMFFARDKGQDNLIQLGEEQLQKLCMIFEQLLDDATGPIRRRIYFLQIFEILSMATLNISQNNAHEISPYIQKALDYMDEHLKESISVVNLADAAGVSVNTLERHFKDVFGITPVVMLRKKRLVESTKYLRANSTVSEAAMESGFTDYSNYIQLFRRTYGMTPLQYKKKIGENIQ